MLHMLKNLDCDYKDTKRKVQIFCSRCARLLLMQHYFIPRLYYMDYYILQEVKYLHQ